jgi:hypothetical protein
VQVVWPKCNLVQTHVMLALIICKFVEFWVPGELIHLLCHLVSHPEICISIDLDRWHLSVLFVIPMVKKGSIDGKKYLDYL